MKLAPLLVVTTTAGVFGTLYYYGDVWGVSKFLTLRDAQQAPLNVEVDSLYYTEGFPEWTDCAAWLASLSDADQEAVLKPFKGSFVCGTVGGGGKLLVNAELTMFWEFSSLEPCTALLERIHASYTTRGNHTVEALNRDLGMTAIKDVKIYDAGRYPPHAWKALKFVMVYKGMPAGEREFWYRTLLWQLEMTNQAPPSLLERRGPHTPQTVFIPKVK